MKGRVIIDNDNIHFGMIRMGFNIVSLYRKDGIMWEQHGGTCVFKGRCVIGNSSAISIGPNGNLTIGDLFSASAALKIVSYNQIEFKDNARIGWENMFLDTNFHSLINDETGERKVASAPIIIGRNNWFGLKCITFKGTETAEYCTIGGGTVLSGLFTEPKSVILGAPAKVKCIGFYRDTSNDDVVYAKRRRIWKKERKKKTDTKPEPTKAMNKAVALCKKKLSEAKSKSHQKERAKRVMLNRSRNCSQ
ncbi:hypothetical protein [Bacteroides sedimenti]|uniref:Acyltransferase n=1 Tax=Bacteroides sedimenti TaxID=2136147 RepID=A0ABN6Z199_9BACE